MIIGVAESQAHGDYVPATYVKAVPTECYAYQVPQLCLRIQDQRYTGNTRESELMENDEASSHQERKRFSVSRAGGSHVPIRLYETNGCYLYLRRSPELVVSTRSRSHFQVAVLLRMSILGRPE
ncbi:hypothetical protein ABVK25_010091 [Lepraria finkii]|uniref:Uncharacterized protein n=1 Tax=Lepraria finkii TaxID=1340010 RepID=A0ABR4AVK7_9LECA